MRFGAVLIMPPNDSCAKWQRSLCPPFFVDEEIGKMLNKSNHRGVQMIFNLCRSCLSDTNSILKDCEIKLKIGLAYVSLSSQLFSLLLGNGVLRFFFSNLATNLPF